MSTCWNSYFNMTGIFKCASLQRVWATDMSDYPLSATVSAHSWFLTGDDSDYAYAQAATSAANTLPLFFRGEERSSSFERQQTPIHLTKLWQGSRAEQGDGVEKAAYEHMGGVNKASLSPGRSFPRGWRCLQSWATTAEMNHGLNFLTHLKDITRNWFNTPPQRWQEDSLYAVAIETKTGEDCDTPSVVGKSGS